jgi:transcriptional regulator with XRE-family HTH domain
MAGEFAQIARAARLAARVTLKEVADKLGVSIAYVSEVERGNRPAPSPSRAIAWARAVRCDNPSSFANAALADRSFVQLDVEAVPDFRRDAAFAFARSFDGLTEEQAEQIQKIVGGSDQNGW